MKENLREIQAYSSNSNGELDYTKKYWFHNWITPKKALIETEEGKLIPASYKEFKFKIGNN